MDEMMGSQKAAKTVEKTESQLDFPKALMMVVQTERTKALQKVGYLDMPTAVSKDNYLEQLWAMQKVAWKEETLEKKKAVTKVVMWGDLPAV